MRYILLLSSLLFLSVLSNAQEKTPKLIVGIVVDQMRQDYLLRFEEHFGADGFRRMTSEGFMFANAHFNYVPTYTAPGHASVYSGTTPATHGIVGNNWFDQQLNEQVYCAYDSTAVTVGADNNNGKMSPHQLLVPTITDQLKFASQMRSKVIGISLKDRGAVFPAGKLGKAYWYDGSTGKIITSNYYHEQLPSWVDAFNARKLPDEYRKKTWETLLPIEKYTASGPDESPYEFGLFDKTTFPYDLKQSKNYGIVSATPYGNELVTELALSALKGENLGQGEETDFLAISYSSTDYIGHNFGPNAVEVQDTYLRLDRNLARLFAALDEQVGKGNYTVFLTSDHGVAEVPKRMMDLNAYGGYLREDITAIVNEFLSEKHGHDDWVRDVSNTQVFLNRELIQAAGEDLEQVRRNVAGRLLKVQGIAETYTFQDMLNTPFDEEGVRGDLRRGFNQERSGDVLFLLRPGYLQSGQDRGSSHGTPYDYDTHVPILWFGAGIRHGVSVRRYTVTDIAPTLAMLLDITLPAGTTGVPMYPVFEE